PHSRGFLILEANEWRALTNGEIEERRREHKGRELTAFLLPVEALAGAKANMGKALTLVIKRCEDRVRERRARGAKDARTGRRHAFLAMQHLNATLARSVYPT